MRRGRRLQSWWIPLKLPSLLEIPTSPCHECPHLFLGARGGSPGSSGYPVQMKLRRETQRKVDYQPWYPLEP